MTSSSVSSHATGSTHRSSISTTNTDRENGEDEWDLLDALAQLRARDSITSYGEGGVMSLKQALLEGMDDYQPYEGTSDVVDESNMQIPHFPPLSEAMFAKDGDGEQPRTSEPITEGIRQNQERSLLSMVEVDRFQQLLGTPMGFLRFQQWVEEDGLPGSSTLLRYFKDLQASMALFDEVKGVTRAIDTVYFNPRTGGADRLLSLPTRPSTCENHLRDASLSLRSAQTEATTKLYNNEFKRFVTGRITEQAKARLQIFPNRDGRGDLGEVFCLADPRLPDQPLVLVSDGFCRLSEYPRDRLIGRNCRFLQGPGTDQQAVKALRSAIEAGREHSTLLLNYTRTGKPFWNLLNMIPLRNKHGSIDYFLGAQIDVTSTISSSKAFENLQQLAQGTGVNAPKDTFTLSDEVWKTVQPSLNETSGIQTLSPRLNDKGATTVPFAAPVDLEVPNSPSGSSRSSNAGKSTWLRKVIKSTPSSQSISTRPSKGSVSVGTDGPDLHPKIQYHMDMFSSAYSKLIVFDAKHGGITYVTPPLLAFLGYSVRSQQDRLSSKLLQKSILDLLVGQTTIETETIKTSVRKVISEEGTHSVFAGLLSSKSSSSESALVEGSTGCVSDTGHKFVRTLLHFTPVRDFKDITQTYIAVVA